MSTAIFRTYIPGTFIIAADSRRSDPSDRSLVSDDAQKIFPIRNIEGSFAVTFSGTVGITADDSKDLVWNVCEAALKSATALESRNTSTLAGLAVRICRPVNQLLGEIRNSGRISSYPEIEAIMPGERGNTIARMFIEGYHRDTPSRVHVRFWHENQRLMEPDIRQADLYPGGNMIYGSQKIGDLLYRSDDPRFSAFRSQALTDPIDNNVQLAVNYIRACSIPEAVTIDEICYSIGGDPHVAIIAQKDGFRWVPGYEPASVKNSAR